MAQISSYRFRGKGRYRHDPPDVMILATPQVEWLRKLLHTFDEVYGYEDRMLASIMEAIAFESEVEGEVMLEQSFWKEELKNNLTSDQLEQLTALIEMIAKTIALQLRQVGGYMDGECDYRYGGLSGTDIILFSNQHYVEKYKVTEYILG